MENNITALNLKEKLNPFFDKFPLLQKNYCEKCLEILRTKISDAVFTDLFASLTLASVSDRRVLVIVPPGKDPKAILPYKGLVELSWQEATGNKADFDFQRQLEKPQAVTAPPLMVMVSA